MAWVFVSLIVLLVVAGNGLAAGVAAVLHAWQVRLPRESRIFVASATAALIPTAVLFVLALVGSSQADGSIGTSELLIVAGACLAVTTIVSLPGAIAVTRKLEAPGDAYRVFE